MATVSTAQRPLAPHRPRMTGSKAEGRQGVLPSVVQMVQASGQGLPARWVGHISPACFLMLMDVAAQVSACSRATLTASKPEHRLTLQVLKIKEPGTLCYLKPGLQLSPPSMFNAATLSPMYCSERSSMAIVSCPLFFLSVCVLGLGQLDLWRIVENLRSPQATKRICFVLFVLVHG